MMKRVIGLRAALIMLVLIAIAPVFAVVVQASLAEQRTRLLRAEASLKSLVELAAAHQERHAQSARQLETSEVLRRLSIPADTTLLVADARGVVLGGAGPMAPAAGSDLPPGFLRTALLEGRARSGRSRDVQGQEWLFALQPVGLPGHGRVHVAGLIAARELLAPSSQRLRTQLGLIALIALLGAGLAWAFADRVLLGPMRRLLDRVDALAQEDQRLDVPPPGARLRELGELHARVHEMARRLAERAVQRDGALAELEHQNHLLESVLESMAEGVLVVDARGRFVHVNRAAHRILPGLQVRGRSFREALDWLADGEFRHEISGELACGRTIVIQGSARPMQRPGQAPTGSVIVFSDITDAWHAERSLRDSEQRYRSLFESNPHPMWVFDTQTLRFLTVNDAAVAHYGYSRQEFLAMSIEDIRPAHDVEALHRRLALQAGKVLGGPDIWLHRRRDGSLIHVEVTSHALDYDGRPARMVLAHDVTERLLAQEALQTMNETLERRVEERTRELAVANEELESFSYSVSHDLRAPLQVIDGFGRALTSRHSDRLDGQARHYLDRIRENTRQMAQLIDDLLALARVTRAELVTEPFDLSVPAKRAADRLRQRYPEREVDFAVQEPMPCTGDARLLAIVMDNLVGNAWKFTSRVPRARIEVGASAQPDGSTTYYVSDNGAGFDMTYADKLFKAFQRLHGAADFEGTGIGLATVHRIVTRHGGSVSAASRPGRGATFSFTLKPNP
ncbi:MAG: PAS domain S-box protein [Burkholderiales bacterium]|nr:PAS domain S-box protein [Burkholderiales bacterium]